MKSIRVLLAMALGLGLVLAAWAGDLVIQSFDGRGKLSFGELPDAISYRVEWACSPAGPWKDFPSAVTNLHNMPATGMGSVTCSVPMCYRVVAILTPATPTNFTISGDAATTTVNTVTITPSYTGLPVYYMASENADFAGATWQVWTGTPTFTLSSGDGVKTVYFKLKNAAGEESPIISDTIVLSVPVNVTLFAINNGATSTTNLNVTLNNACSGTPVQFLASEDAGFAGASWQGYSTAPVFLLSAGTAVKTLYFKVRNEGGSESASTNDSISYIEPIPPSISQQPQSVTNTVGSNVSFNVTAAGTPPLACQWRKGGTNLTDAGRMSGSTSNVLAISTIDSTDAGSYNVIVTNAYGTITSEVAVLVVLLPTHTVILHPGAHGSIAEANSGSNYVTTVTHGAAFPTVTVNPEAGYAFTGWNPAAQATVTNDFEATANYIGVTNILTDDFNDGVLNQSIWTTNVPFADSLTEESSGNFHLAGGGQLITKGEFNPANGPITITTRFLTGSIDDCFYFWIRSDSGLGQNGIFIGSGNIYSGYLTSIYRVVNGSYDLLAQGSYAMPWDNWYDLSITDDGTNIALYVNNTLAVSATNSTVFSENHVVFGDRANEGWMDNHLYLDSVGIAGPLLFAPVPMTGQTNSVASGDDGALRKGVPWPTPRFTDNGNGTVTDNLTGLVWLKNAHAFGFQDWATALNDCATLNSGEAGLTDGSVEGDWRLPNVRELMSLLDRNEHDPALPSGHPFADVQLSRVYFTSTTRRDHTDNALTLTMALYGFPGNGVKTDPAGVWPVRGGEGSWPARVAKTGAKDIPGYTAVAGEDGHAAMRKGVASPVPRFTDNGNGTVTDNLTGLIWLKNANAFGFQDWTTALNDCATLNSGEAGLTDGSVEGDWRLPNINELHTLVDHGEFNPAIPSGCLFTNVQTSKVYWSGTFRSEGAANRQTLGFMYGIAGDGVNTSPAGVWPVRGGR